MPVPALVGGMRVDQLDPDTSNGEQVPGLVGGLTQLAPQPGQVHVDRFVSPPERLIPNGSQKLTLGNHLSTSSGQEMQQIELLHVVVLHVPGAVVAKKTVHTDEIVSCPWVPSMNPMVSKAAV